MPINFSQMFPGSQLPPILSGAMAGAQIPFALRSGEQELQSQDIRNMSDLDKLQMMKESEDPMKRAQNSLAQAQAESNNDPDLIAALKAKVMSEAQTSPILDEGKKRQEQDQFLYDLSNEIIHKRKAGQKVYDPLDETSKSWWDEQVKDAKKRGITLPPVPDVQPDGSSKVFDSLVAKNSAIADSIAQRNAMAKQELVNKGNIAGHEISASAAQYTADRNAQSREDVAKTAGASRIAAANARAQALMPATQYVINEIANKRTPDPALVRMAAESLVTAELQKTYEGTQLLILAMDPDQSKAQAAKEAKIQEKINYLSKGQVSPEDKAVAATGSTPPAAPSGSPAPTKSGQVKAADLGSLPPPSDPNKGVETDKGTYYYDPIRKGWTNRKPTP